jgi:hypothetical protein
MATAPLMTTATHPSANGDRTAAIQARHRAGVLRRWQPRSEHYRELLARWKRESEHVAGAAPRYRLCSYCGAVNKDGEAESGFLHWHCYEALLRYDAEYAEREGTCLRVNGKPVGEPEQGCGQMIVLRAMAAGDRALGISAIVLAAWRADPSAFGLAGCEEHWPCSTRVRNALFGRRGLLKRGYVVKATGGAYAVTPAGRALAGNQGAGR